MPDLPRRGMLLFFCDEESLPYGGPEDSDAFCVAYLPQGPDDETRLADVPEKSSWLRAITGASGGCRASLCSRRSPSWRCPRPSPTR